MCKLFQEHMHSSLPGSEGWVMGSNYCTKSRFFLFYAFPWKLWAFIQTPEFQNSYIREILLIKLLPPWGKRFPMLPTLFPLMLLSSSEAEQRDEILSCTTELCFSALTTWWPSHGLNRLQVSHTSRTRTGLYWVPVRQFRQEKLMCPFHDSVEMQETFTITLAFQDPVDIFPGIPKPGQRRILIHGLIGTWWWGKLIWALPSELPHQAWAPPLAPPHPWKNWSLVTKMLETTALKDISEGGSG